MSDDRYLWDRSGPPDPEVERLERALAPLRVPIPPPELAPPARTSRRTYLTATAAGLGTLAAAASFGLWWRGRAGRSGTMAGVPGATPGTSEQPALTLVDPRAWRMRLIGGQARVGTQAVTARSHLRPGELLETAADGRVQLEVPQLGSVEVEPYTRVELLATSGDQQRLRLQQGTLQVLIAAPPGRFYVDTHAGTVVDLGCAYTVELSPSGHGRLHVRSGWVGFQLQDREALIPEGAECTFRAGQGPGTPRMADAPIELRRAVTLLDGPAAAQEDQAMALGTVLALARPQDAFTLWHLLDRVPPESRPSVLLRLVKLVPATAAVNRKRVLAGDRQARDRLWDHLGLEPIAHWRKWKAETR